MRVLSVGRWAPPMPAARVGSSWCESVTSFVSSPRIALMVLLPVKKGSFDMLQATMLGWLRWIRIMSVSVPRTFVSNGA